VYRTHDGGKSWQLTASGIPDGSFVNAVREDPVRRGLLYAGTEKGVYVSFDDGDHWQSLQANLPVTSVRDLDVHGDGVVIATHGRAFWVLDDVTPLRQLDARVESASAWLFAPATAVRLRSVAFTGTPMPRDEPAAPNPPNGALIDYVLKSGARQPVTLEIRDAQGALVRRYSSADAPPKADPAKLTVTPDWVKVPSTLSAAPGHHRFVWPLRYPPPKADNPYADSVWAPPGRYTLVLEVDGARLTQPLTVVPDPRVSLPPQAYIEQFALARRIEEESVKVAAAAAEADGLIDALGERRQGADSAIATAIEALQARAVDLSGAILPKDPQPRWWLTPRSVSSLRFLAGALNRLATAVDDSDGAPSPDAVAGFEKLQTTLVATLGAWEALKAKDLAALNARLRKAGVAEIAAKP